MNKMDKAIEGLAKDNEKIRILSLMQIHSSPVGELESSPEFSRLVKHLSNLCLDGSLDIRFLSKKLLNKFQRILGDNLELPNETPSFEIVRNTTEPLLLSKILRQVDKPTDMDEREVLLSMLSHGDSRVRSNAVEAMDRHYHDVYHDALLRRMEDSSNRVCANAIIAIGKRNMDEVLTKLSALLTHESLAMRESALYCLHVLPWHKDFTPYVQDALLDPYTPVAIRAVSLLKKYSPDGYQKLLEEIYFESPSTLLREEIREFWKREGIPNSVRETIREQTLSKEFRDLGVKIFQELKSVEPFTPQLRSRYFLIIRQQDVLKVILDQGEGEISPDFTLTVKGLQEKIKNSFVILGRTAFELHQNREFFFEQCSEIIPRIDLLLKD